MNNLLTMLDQPYLSKNVANHVVHMLLDIVKGVKVGECTINGSRVLHLLLTIKHIKGFRRAGESILTCILGR
jgi:hypothetical protein